MTQKIRVGINGFGRIGRKIARLAITDERVEIVGINDLTSAAEMVHLLKYDSVHGTLPPGILENVRLEGTTLHLGKKQIKLFAEKDPTKLPWKDIGADFVHECTGIFTSKEKAGMHIAGGAKKVIISAPANDSDLTICMGVNHEKYNSSQHHIVSNASCTTNCLAPAVKVLDDAFGVVRGSMLTVHSYTNDQRILDIGHKDPRRARAAALSQIPTTTGAAKAVGLVLPHLKGKLDGMSIRVPTPNVSCVNFVGEIKRATTKDEVNAAFLKAANGPMKDILGYSTEPLVSIDYNGNILSSTIDAECTTVIEGNMVTFMSWYDNESGFSKRMLDLTIHMAGK